MVELHTLRGARGARRVAYASALLLACAAGAALGQDSTSRNSDAGNGLPGDGLSPWTFGLNQRASYVVDMATLTTSTGTTFGAAPVIKSGKTSANRFTALNGTSTISASVKNG